MTDNVKQDVSIRVALAGQESWKSYRKAMADARAETAQLKRDLQEITNIGKAFEAQKIFSTPGGFYRAVNGQSFQGQQRAQRQMDMGLPGMQELAQAGELLRLSAQLLKTFDQLGGILTANKVTLGATEAELRSINNLTEAKNRLTGTEIQLADALKQKDQARVADLSRQRDILKDQTKALENEARAREELKKQVEREENRIQKQRDAAIQAGIKQDFDAIRKAEEDRVKAEEQAEARIQKQRENAVKSGIKQDFDAIRKAEEDRVREAQRAEDRIQKQRENAVKAGIQQDFQAIRKAEEDRVREAQRAEDRIQKQREAAINAENLRAIKQAYKEGAAPETTAAQRDNANFKEYMAGAVRQRAEMISLDRTEAEIRANINTQYEAGLEKAALTNRIRQAGKAGLVEEVTLLEKQKNLVEQINRDLAKQPKPKLTPQQTIANQRQHSLERLFGDGGASLMAIQAGISANYAALGMAKNAISGGVQFTADFDRQMRDVQAITVTTDENMANLKDRIIEVSQSTRFMATDVADAAMTLGQAGLSTQEIADSLQAVALLASATGTDLKQSVDIATSVIGVFDLEASNMASVANTLTSAVNMSKLNIDKLALGLQYAGNTAAQSGVSFEELTATLGAMSNAGIRSGSTLGTGVRQILVALEKPSKEFRETLERLGISMADIDIRANGLYGVLKNLKEGGFTASDAMRSFEVRAAAAFNAASGNLDDIVRIERAFLNQTTASKASETQMRSLSNQSSRFQSNLKVLVSTGLEPLMYALRDLVSTLADFFAWLQKFPATVQVITTAVTALAVSFAAVRTAVMLINLAAITKELVAFSLGFRAAAVGVEAAGAAATVAAGSMTAVLGVIGLVSAALVIGYNAWSSYTDEIGRASEGVEKAQTALDNSMGALEQTRTEMGMVDEKVKELSDRSDVLTKNQNLLQLETSKVQEQFKGMGIKVDTANSTVETLIASLKALRGELDQKYIIQIEASKESLANLMAANRSKMEVLASSVTPENQVGLWAKYPAAQKNAGLLERARAMGTNDQVANQALLAEIDARISQYDTLSATKGIEPGRFSPERGSLDALRETRDLLSQIVSIQAQQVSLEAQYGDQVREAAKAKNLSDNPVIAGKVTNFADTARSRVRKASETAPNDSVKQFTAANTETIALEAEAKALKDEIRNNASLNVEVQDQLIQSIDNALADGQKLRDDLMETALNVTTENEKLQSQLNDAKDRSLSTRLDLATNGEQVDVLSAKRAALVNETYNAGLARLGVQTKGDTTSKKYIDGLENLKADRDAEMQKIHDEATAKIAEIMQRSVTATENTIKDIENEIRAAGDLEFAKRRPLYDKLAAAISDKADQEVAVIEETVKNVDDKANQIASIRAEEQAALLGVMEQKAENDVSEAQNQMQMAEDALANVEELAAKATSLAQLAALLKKAMVLISQRAKAGIAAANADPNDDLTLSGAIADGASYLGDWIGKFAKWNYNVKKYGHAGGRMFGSGGAGGGGGGGNKKSPEELMVEQMDQRVKSVEALLKARLIDGATGVAQLTDYLSTAKEEMANLDAKIAAMQGKVNGGQMTVEDLEKVNDLLKAREELTKQQIAAEALLAEQYVKQGNYFQAASTLARNWATENLDMAKTFQQGFENVLSTLTSGFAQLFVDLASGTKSAGEAFRDFAASVVKSLLQMISQMIAVYIMQKLIGMVFPGAQAPGSFGAIAQSFVGLGKMTGGAVRKAGGGMVDGNLARDSKLHNLMPGEYVLRKSAVDMVGVDTLDQMNAMGNRAMAAGGHVGVMSQKKGPIGQTNVYVVTPEQKPVPGPSDIIAVINDDISRGGPTKKLIKTVAMGY